MSEPVVAAQDSDLTSDWQKRLRWTGLDDGAKDEIIRAEQQALKAHDRAGKDFVDTVLRIHRDRGNASGEDMARALRDAMQSVIDSFEADYSTRYTEIHQRAQDHALKRIGVDPVSARTARLIAASRSRTADVFPDRISENLSGSLNRVKSLAPDVVDNLRKKLSDTPMSGTTTEKVLRSMIGDAIDDLDISDPKAMRDAVREIWTKTKSDLQRVIRTETINAYSKAQLQEWWDQGIRQVTRHCIDDGRACALCRELCRPGNNVYDIELLLKLEHPVTEDPWNPGEFYTHPNCRDWFEPVLEDVWGEYESLERDLFVDMDGPSARAIDVPIDSQDSVARILNEVRIEQDFQFVPDITQMREWQDTRLEELLSDDPQNAMMRLDSEVRSGGVLHWTDPVTGVTYVADDARYGTWVTLPFARRAGEWEWETAGDDRDWWRRRWNSRRKDVGKTLERDGVEIVGGEPFFSQVAGESAKDYFVEAFAYYLVSPVILRAMDPDAYNRMRDKMFSGVEYAESGGVK